MRSPTAQTWFCATSKSGLGHLRRCSNIAHGLRKIAPDAELGLVTNAGTEGLDKSDLVLFRDIVLTGRSDMAARLAGSGAGPVIVDTAIVPGIELLDRPLVLILREMPDHKVGQFRLPGGRKWDLVIVPNPADHWLPDADRLSAGRTEAVGWIYRKTRRESPATSEIPVLLVATGGGGTEATASLLRDIVDRIILATRRLARRRFTVRQAIGARLPPSGILNTADETVDPKGKLNVQFTAADAVISSAGYNSVLELASVAKPAMLIAISRSIDDQQARAKLWGPRLGHCFDGNIEGAAQWLADGLSAGFAVKPWDLGTSGERIAAQLIRSLQ